jgi:hypothetical protein
VGTGARLLRTKGRTMPRSPASRTVVDIEVQASTSLRSSASRMSAFAA